ncbi:MAG: hypothetical protein ABJQ29_16785 [Luteolibacter sp.]
MPETEPPQAAPRRWSAFVCPDCRFVLRVPRDHDGVGIVCPSCRRMLRIPEEGEASAPLMAVIQKVSFAPAPSNKKKQRRRKKKNVMDAAVPDWESGKGREKGEGADWKGLFKTTTIWGFSFTVIAGLVFLFLKTTEPAPEVVEMEIDPEGSEVILEVPASLTAGLDEEELVPKSVRKRSEAEFLSLAEALARKFLGASTVDEILPLVSNPNGVEEKIRRDHPDGKIDPVGFSGFSANGGVVYKNGEAAVSFLTADQEHRQLVFSEGKDGLKIDWESWAGWSDLPWKEILESKPTDPVLVRVISKPVPYYNFGFSDDSEWVSYLLLSPDQLHTLYGYAKRGSSIDEQLRPADPNGSMAVTLKIRFPKGGASGSQVEIEQFLADGWVLSAEKN